MSGAEGVRLPPQHIQVQRLHIRNIPQPLPGKILVRSQDASTRSVLTPRCSALAWAARPAASGERPRNSRYAPPTARSACSGDRNIPSAIWPTVIRPDSSAPLQAASAGASGTRSRNTRYRFNTGLSVDADGVNRLSSVYSANRRPGPERTDRLANRLPKTRSKDSSIAIIPKIKLQPKIKPLTQS